MNDNAISLKQGQQNYKTRNVWVILKNIGVVEKWALKKEEQEKKIRKNKVI